VATPRQSAEQGEAGGGRIGLVGARVSEAGPRASSGWRQIKLEGVVGGVEADLNLTSPATERVQSGREIAAARWRPVVL
jgi:hypothetical protein